MIISWIEGKVDLKKRFKSFINLTKVSDKMLRIAVKNFGLYTENNVNTFTHRHKGVEYVLRNENFRKPIVLGRLVEDLGQELPTDKKPKNVVKLGIGGSSKGHYVRYEEVPEKLKKEVLKRW